MQHGSNQRPSCSLSCSPHPPVKKFTDWGHEARKGTDTLILMNAACFVLQWLSKDVLTLWGAKVRTDEVPTCGLRVAGLEGGWLVGGAQILKAGASLGDLPLARLGAGEEAQDGEACMHGPAWTLQHLSPNRCTCPKWRASPTLPDFAGQRADQCGAVVAADHTQLPPLKCDPPAGEIWAPVCCAPLAWLLAWHSGSTSFF